MKTEAKATLDIEAGLLALLEDLAAMQDRERRKLYCPNKTPRSDGIVWGLAYSAKGIKELLAAVAKAKGE